MRHNLTRLTIVEPTATPAAVDAMFAKSPGCFVCCWGDATELAGWEAGTLLREAGLGCAGCRGAGLENPDDLPPERPPDLGIFIQIFFSKNLS